SQLLRSARLGVFQHREENLRIAREVLKHHQVVAEEKYGHPVLRFQFFEKADHLGARPGLILNGRVQSIQEDDGGAREPHSVRERTRRERRRVRLRGDADGGELIDRNFLAVVEKSKVVASQARDGVALRILCHYVHLDQASLHAQDGFALGGGLRVLVGVVRSRHQQGRECREKKNASLHTILPFNVLPRIEPR